MSSGLDVVFVGLLIAVLLPICLADLLERRIPNLCNAAVALLGLAHGLAHDPGPGIVIKTLIHVGLAVLLIGGTTALMRRVAKDAQIGGGDVKFLIAASFWVGMDGVVIVLVLACLAYIAVTLVCAPWRGLDMRRTQPFAPMLAFGMLVVVVAVALRT